MNENISEEKDDKSDSQMTLDNYPPNQFITRLKFNCRIVA